MSVSGAIQPRINKAIIDRLSADTIDDPQVTGTSLQEAMQEAGAVVVPYLPLYWHTAPVSASAPFLVYGSQETQIGVEHARCGTGNLAEPVYEVRLVVDSAPGEEAYLSSEAIAVVDRLAVLLDTYSVTINSNKITFLREGEVCYPDFTASERGRVHMGVVYRVQVR